MELASIPIAGRPLDDLLSKQWLLTNQRGGYSSSTIVGCNTSRYHGLLIGSPNPLANRLMALAGCVEMVVFTGYGGLLDVPPNGNGKAVFNLSTFEFNGKFAPEGFKYLKRFRRDIGAHFDYQLGQLEITKSVYLLEDDDTVVLVYDFTNFDDLVFGKHSAKDAEPTVEFVLRPLVGMRDFHGLQKSFAPLRHTCADGSLLICQNVPGSCELVLSGSRPMDFSEDRQWWFNFVYREDRERGQEFMEDLWSPGFFKCRLDMSAKVVLQANLRICERTAQLWGGPTWEPACIRANGPDAAEEDAEESSILEVDVGKIQGDLRRHRDQIRHRACQVGRGQIIRDERYDVLCAAGAQFLATRCVEGKPKPTVIAGFPWFADWGRDAFVSLPGLLLLTGRADEAKSMLANFALAADEGMIPNRFDDYSETACFNSIDASLWFVEASFKYLVATGDSGTFTRQLLPTIRWIVDCYQKGTRFGIHADSDGLITGGDSSTQLTWMDAKCDGIAFTARDGKAVEINALWYSGLCQLARFYAGRDIKAAKHYRDIAHKVGNSFCVLFWNEQLGHLNDTIVPDGSIDATLRPNQIFAVSLPFSALSFEQQQRVVTVVEERLLTPYGLRTLSVEGNRYRGQYVGPQHQRDEAYHQGTVWPYLMGPFVEAYLRVNKFSKKSRKRAAELIEPLLKHLTEDGCIGQISEIFDGDPPYKPRGCFAQAWSVAELIRAYHLINS